MTRQIALGAVIAFGLTVLVLSVWSPSAPPSAPAAPPPAPPAPPGRVLTPLSAEKPFRPLRPESINRLIRAPVILQVIDAGAPTP